MKPGEIGSWTAPDGLGYSGLRPVRLSGSGYALSVFALVFVIGGLLLGNFLWLKSRHESAQREELELEGARADATIVRLWRSGGEDSSRRMSYRFEIDGQVVTGSTKVPKRTWSTLRTGATIPVVYLPGDPAINYPEAWRRSVTPVFLAVLVPSMFGGFAALLGLTIMRQSRLLREGRPAPAVVVKTQRSDKAVVVTYEFRVLSGAVRKGRSSASGKSVPAEGSVLCVMYDPENPRRHAIYPFCLVKLEGVRRG